MSHRAVAVVAVALGMLAQMLPAAACTCVPRDPRDELKDAEGAMVGTVVARRTESGESASYDVYTFQVDEAFKGDLGETVDVYTGSQGNTCGFVLEVGDQAGLLMSFLDDGAAWWSSTCDAMHPDELRRAAAPLPQPDGRGPARVLVGGSWGESSYMVLDARGRTLGYGLGDESGVQLEVCPGARRFLEVYRRSRGWRLALRSMASNRLVGRGFQPLDPEVSPYAWVPAASCGGDGWILAAFADWDRPGWGNIDRIRGRDHDRRYFGRLDDAVFPGGGVAYVRRDRQIVSVGLSSGRVEEIVKFRTRPYSLVVSPDRSRLATFLGRDLAVVDLDDGAVRRRNLRREYAQVEWMDEDHLVLFPYGGRGRVTVVPAGRGRPEPVDGDWSSFTNAVVGRYGYGLDGYSLWRVRLPDGPVEVVRSFDSPEIESLAAVRPPRDVAWPPPP